MRKITVLTIFVFLLVQQAVYSQTTGSYSSDRAKCYAANNSVCYQKLLTKYSDTITQSDKNKLMYDYGCQLIFEKQYEKAKRTFNYVIANEHYNTRLIDNAKTKISEIQKKKKEITTQKKSDIGDYYDSEDHAKWDKPLNIKVYIESKTGKEYLFRKAIAIWNEKLAGVVHFNFVKKADDADITMTYVDELHDGYAGYATYKFKYVDGKRYFDNVKVEVAFKHSNRDTHPDMVYLNTTLHELGHAIGITSHSSNLNDIMYKSTVDSYRKGDLSQKDINTAKAIYMND